MMSNDIVIKAVYEEDILRTYMENEVLNRLAIGLMIPMY